MNVEVHENTPATEDFLQDVLRGLSKDQKILPCKYLYDQRGSELFEEICVLDEYYQTRTEIAIMRNHAAEMAAVAGPNCLLIEFGSGASVKTRVLLDHLHDAAGYVPIDISLTMLRQTSRELTCEYPGLPITPLCADYTAPIDLPGELRSIANRWVYFPGSTIGNFHPDVAQEFLRRMAALVGHAGGILVGVDLKKHRETLEAAYDDAPGVTAAFNLNLLERMNRELDATFDVDEFRHEARYNEPDGRIEMHLVSTTKQAVAIGDERTIHFDENESIRTECSYKYHIEEFGRLAEDAGLRLDRVWSDSRNLFSVQLLRTG